MVFCAKLFVLFCLLWTPLRLPAQILSSARQLGMGESGTSSHSEFPELLGNVAGLGLLKRPTLFAGHRYLFHQPDVQVQYIQFAYPIGKHGIGVMLSHFGLEQAYKDLRIGLSYAKRFGPHLSIGIAIQRQQLEIPGYLDHQSLFLELGTLYRFTDQLSVGLKLAHLNLSGTSKIADSQSDFEFNAGFYYLFDRQLGLALDLVRAPGFPIILRGGIEYYLVPETFSLRLGLSSRDLIPTAGLGVLWSNFRLDIGTNFHPLLGMSPQIDLSYAF